MSNTKGRGKPAPLSAAERKAAQKARRQAQGLVRYAVWIPDTQEAKEAIRKAAEKLQE